VILVDTALAKRAAQNRPIRIGIVGAGCIGRFTTLQIVRSVPGIRIVAISNRHPERAMDVVREAGGVQAVQVGSAAEMARASAPGTICVTDDPALLTGSDDIELIIEATGTIEFALQVALDTLAAGKHLLSCNAELDGTVGPMLKHLADERGVMVSNMDGDQPGSIMNLYRTVVGMGVRPVLAGNIKGLQDAYRTPATQKAFAEKWNQTPSMVTSFADGSKISFEQTLVANATGMRVGTRGMYGPSVEPGTPIEEAPAWYPESIVDSPTGIVDYVIGASPGPGVFVLGTLEDPARQLMLDLYKMGKGPLYCFHTPFHLCFFEVPNTVARMVLFGDAAVAPEHGPVVDVVATAKRDLKAGETLDGIGHYTSYGQCENADLVHAERLLPIGIVEDCVLLRDVARDTVLSYDDVRLPEGRVVDRVRADQNARFFS